MSERSTQIAPKRWITASLNTLSPEERIEQRGKQFPHPFSLAELLHENSKYHPDLMSACMPLIQYATPNYADLRTDEYVDLPSLRDLPQLEVPLGEALGGRRTQWDFALPIHLQQLIMTLQYAFGVSAYKSVQDHDGSSFNLRLRTYPSGGALYPIQVMIYAQKVEGLESGLYRFSAYDNRLYRIASRNLDQDSLSRLTPSTDPERNPIYAGSDFSQAAFFCFLFADFTNQSDKYGLRAYRLALLEAGHAAQNLLLVTTALRLNSVPLAGFYDDRAHQLLQLDGVDQALLYMIPVGKSKET